MAKPHKERSWYLDLNKTRSALRSVKELLTLDEKRGKAFLDCFDVWSIDWEDKLAEHPDDFEETSRKVADWYSVVNLLCSIGQIEKMYIPPHMVPGKSVHYNQIIYERLMAKDLQVDPDDTLLELGCGRGRVLNHVQALTGANIIGYNYDETQVVSGKAFAEATGVADKCSIHVHDLNDVPYPLEDESIAGVYEIGAICYSLNLSKLFQEVYRILKPGGRLSLLDICMYEAYDRKNPDHRRMMELTKPLTGLLRALYWDEYLEACNNSGLVPVINDNPSVDGHMVPMIEYLNKYFAIAKHVVRAGAKMRLFSQQLPDIFTKFNEGGEGFRDFDALQLGTIAQYMVFEKPR